MMEGVLFSPLRRIATPKGEVRHALRASDAGFSGFGEAYFTEILGGETKGWKRHRRMTMNLVVVCGTVRFVIHDGTGSRTIQDLSVDGIAPYGRLTVPPGLWMAFRGIRPGSNLLMNLASLPHDPDEADTAAVEAFPFE